MIKGNLLNMKSIYHTDNAKLKQELIDANKAMHIMHSIQNTNNKADD